MSDYIYGSSLRAAKSKANYLFEGDFRRRPNQNLSGASRSLARGELLHQAVLQRQNREDVRQKEQASLKIQSVWRGYRCRTVLADKMRRLFDSKFSTNLCAHDLDLLSRQFIIFYHSKKDDKRFSMLIRYIVKNIGLIVTLKAKNQDIWLYRIISLLKIDLDCIRKNPSSLDSGYIEFIELFTRLGDILCNDEAYLVWTALVRHGFFSTIRHYLDSNSELITDSRCTTIHNLISSPLETYNEEFTYKFFVQFLHGPMQPAIYNNFYPRILETKVPGLKPDFVLKSFKQFTAADKFNRIDARDGTIGSESSIWVCFSFVKAIVSRTNELVDEDKADFLCLLASLLGSAEHITNLSLKQTALSEESESHDDHLETSEASIRSTDFQELNSVIDLTINCVNDPALIHCIKPVIVNSELKPKVQRAIVQICNLMLDREYFAIYNRRLLQLVAFNRDFLRSLWKCILTSNNVTLYGTSTPIYQQLTQGVNITPESWRLILPPLKLLCSLCKYLLPTLDDEEFYTSEQSKIFSSDDNLISNPEDQAKLIDTRSGTSNNYFMDKELIGISAILRDMCVGLIEILYQDNRYTLNYRSSISSRNNFGPDDDKSKLLNFEIKNCFKALVRLLCQLHSRDSRKQFCPDGHWICGSLMIPANKAIDFQLVTSQQGRLLSHMTRDDDKADRLSTITTSETKIVLILQEIPFVISFYDRVQIFQQLLLKEKMKHQSEGYHFGLLGTAIQVQIRRNYIYEDAFEKLSPKKEPNMKLPLKVSLINAVGADEAGIDGGGVSKEFLGELLKAGFDPMRGFFKSTKDQLLYPNPSANVIFANLPEGFEVHYEFLGRILGKAIFEKIMVELPLATFFMAKLLARRHSSDVDIHNLASLDPVLYKNLVYLKNYKGDVADLNLDFTISNNDLDEHEVIELKPGGSKIPVTRENRIEYVHLVADYRLNKQIRTQCAAFKRGLCQIIDLDWLRMFDPRELQILISGAPTDIDISDWRRHTLYSNGYSDNSEAVVNFWRVVDKFDENQKRKLLKFATSCSLPPLLGFKDLIPQFTIAPSEETRLPTASTCMNLLKLPDCEDESTIRDKLLYAIESNSGFELS